MGQECTINNLFLQKEIMTNKKFSLSNPFKKRKMNRQCEQQYGKGRR